MLFRITASVSSFSETDNRNMNNRFIGEAKRNQRPSHWMIEGTSFLDVI
jgi:hypothetical protein